MSPTNEQSSGNSVWVVDDNKEAAFTLSMLLKIKGYQVSTYHSGQDALEAAERQRPDAVVLDLAMPGLDGYDTCRLLRQRPQGADLLVIALSGYGKEEDIRQSFESGFNAHLVKPVDLVRLIELLENSAPAN